MFRSTILAAGAAVFLPLAAEAATYEIDFSVGGVLGIIGTFEAPMGGGMVSNFNVTIADVLFDTQVAGGAFEFDPAQGDFVNYTGFPAFTNSTAAAICPAMLCGLELYPTPGDPLPGDYLAIDALFNNIDDGTFYEIRLSQVPLPATAGLLAAALGGLALRRRS